MSTDATRIYGEISGAVVMIGFGSIGRGTLPLLERHFKFNRSRMVVIDPVDDQRSLLDERGIRFLKVALTQQNHEAILTPLLKGNGQGFCVNLSVDVCSLDVMKLCRRLGAFYIDTVVEPWAGFYFDTSKGNSARSNYALRETLLEEKRENPGGVTAVSCCGANPGMVSWFVKEALVNLAKDTLSVPFDIPHFQEEWGKLMQQVGVKGIHIAERDTQRSKSPKRLGRFVNTWSVEGFVSEGMQPAELGWGTHEKQLPKSGRQHEFGGQAAIYLLRPGANTRVRSWCPSVGPQYGRLVTHNESISIADYFTVGSKENPHYRPTCHYAYHPCNDAILSLEEMFGKNGERQREIQILDETEIADGVDELGVLLYGHKKNAYWYGSQLSIEETRRIAPYQNATGLQVTSAVIAGMAWALDNPDAGIVEADEMDFRTCLEFQRPYLGPVNGFYTDWNPIQGRPGLFPDDINKEDPWQFQNVLVD